MIKVGDEIKVINAKPKVGETYKNGDIFQVGQVFGFVANPPVYESVCGIEFYAEEVECCGTYVDNLESFEEKSFFGGEGGESFTWDSRAIAKALAPVSDTVHSPSHYTQGGIETIDMIAEVTGGYSDGFLAHCAGTAVKYISRAPHKHDSPEEDLRKAKAYIDFALKHLEERE